MPEPWSEAGVTSVVRCDVGTGAWLVFAFESGPPRPADLEVVAALFTVACRSASAPASVQAVGEPTADPTADPSAIQLRRLIESSPDAVLLLGGEGQVVLANSRAVMLLRADPVGRRLFDLLPEPAEEVTQGVKAHAYDGTDLLLDVAWASLGGTSEQVAADRAVFLHDARPRQEAELAAAALRAAQARRRHCLEMNDTVLQGLVAASAAADLGQASVTRQYLSQTLEDARQMMSNLLQPLDGADIKPGDLIRSSPATLTPAAGLWGVTLESPARGRAKPTTPGRQPRVLIVDDSEDMRALLTFKLQAGGLCEVVGEAADGEAAVRLAVTLGPDLVFLDLGMPGMDGLTALPLIKAAVPRARVVTLGEFGQQEVGAQALAAGAARHLEAGSALHDLADLVRSVMLDHQEDI